MKVTGSSKHFPVFDTKGPVPGGFDDAGGVGVFEQDGGIVVYFRVDGWFYAVGDRGDGNGSFAMHQPCHQIGTIAAEIADGSATVLDGVGEPFKEVGAAADLFGTFVTIVDDHLTGCADSTLGDQLEDLLIGVVPGGFIVDEHLDMILCGESCDAIGVFYCGGERFLYHYRDVFWGANFNNTEVFGDGVIGENGVGMGMADEGGEVGVEEGIGELIRLFITGDELWIGFGDACDDHFSAFELVHDIVNMVMRKTGYSYM